MHLKRSMLFVSALLLTQVSCTTPQRIPVSLEPPVEQEYIEKDLKIGLALGGGGANGLAHITVLEAFDQLGLTPHRISGTSIGAIMGALYASGKSARQIKDLVDRLVADDADTWRELLLDRQVFRWITLVDSGLGEGGLVDGKAFIVYLHSAIGVETFEDLKIPLSVVAADLWTREEVVFDSGALYPAVQASMAVPGLFTPVVINGRVLVDGGVVNPVPYELLFEDCDMVVAVNVIGKRVPIADPSSLDVMFAATRAMQTAILDEKLKRSQPDLFADMQILDVRMLEFEKFDDIDEQARPTRDLLKQQLRDLVRDRSDVRD